MNVQDGTASSLCTRAGKHFVTLKKEGYKKAVAPAQVVARKESLVALPLARSEKYLLVEQARAKVEAALGRRL